MLSFTFDTNCLIDLDDTRPAAEFVLKIIEAHRSGSVEASFIAVSASERQPKDDILPSYKDFIDRLDRLGLSDIPHIMGMFYFDLSYLDHAVLSCDKCFIKEKRIHEHLFPKIPYSFEEFVSANNLLDVLPTHKSAKKWRNAWCDRQMIWAHMQNERDIFVTSDRNFRRLHGRPGFENIQVMTPEEAVAELPEM